MTTGLRVAIVGGSIGGLTAATLLHEIGCDVHVYERSSEALQGRGAGIVVLPMTERYFTERGGEENRVSLSLTWWKYLDAAGFEVSGDADFFRFSSWNTVYRALRAAFPESRYHLNSEMVDVAGRDDGANIYLADGRTIEADLVVCADGVASTARNLLLPGVDPAYAGYVAWRGTAQEQELSAEVLSAVEDSMLYQVLSPGHILIYAIPGENDSTVPGTRLLNFVWYRNYPVGGPYEDLMTDRNGELRSASVPPGFLQEEHVAEMRSATDELAPVLREIVLASKDPFVQAIFDLEVPQMVFGRVCLLGDAAFAARPHVAAGTAKAAADGWALRDALESTNLDPDAALAIWEPQQLELGRAVVEKSRRMGQRAQFEGTMYPGDPTWKFGLFEPGN